MELIKVSICCLLWFEMTTVLLVVLARRYLSIKWQRKAFSVISRHRSSLLAAAALVFLLFLNSYFKLKTLQGQTYRRVTADPNTRLQYNTDKAFAQRDMYMSLFDVYLAVILWIIVDTDKETDVPLENHPESPSHGPSTSLYQRIFEKLSANSSTSTEIPTFPSSTDAPTRFRVTINAPTTSSATDYSQARVLSTPDSSKLHPRSSKSLDMDPRSLQEIQESVRRVPSEARLSNGFEDEEDESIHTDPRSLEEIQRAILQGSSDRGSSTGVELL